MYFFTYGVQMNALPRSAFGAGGGGGGLNQNYKRGLENFQHNLIYTCNVRVKN